MAIKKYGPNYSEPPRMTVTDYSVLSKVAPERSLLEPMKKHSGRNNTGRITVRPGGGNRTKYPCHRLQASEDRCARYRQDSSTIRTAAHSSLWSSTPTASRAHHCS